MTINLKFWNETHRCFEDACVLDTQGNAYLEDVGVEEHTNKKEVVIIPILSSTLKNKRGRDIYQGDIIVIHDYSEPPFEVTFENGKFNIADIDTTQYVTVGNIFEPIT